MEEFKSDIYINDNIKLKIDKFMRKKSVMVSDEIYTEIKNLDVEIKDFFDFVYSYLCKNSMVKDNSVSSDVINKFRFGRNFNELFTDYLNIVLGIEAFEKEVSDEDILVSCSDMDLVKQYLFEIGKIPLLSIDDERKLATAYSNGDEEAGELLINSNLRLVVSIAKRYVGRGLSFMDLIQAGNESLVENAKRFTPDRGTKFATYMTWWIRQGITRSIANNGRTIRIPVHRLETIIKMNRFRESFFTENGREATIEEISKDTGFSCEKVCDLLSEAEYVKSLDLPIKEGNDTCFRDIVVDDKTLPPEESFVNEDLRGVFEEVFSSFTERERIIIKLRFGFIDGTAWTLDAVGKHFDLTRERIRQIEARFLRKIKIHKHIEKLAPFYYSDYNEKDIEKICVDKR